MILKERNCNIFVASADCPDSCRGIDLSLIHCSEVAFWKSSATASPERVVKAAFSGVVDSTDSMIVLESTANGRNNYFYREFHDASRGFSRFTPMFIPWFWIPYYECHIDDVEAFAHWLLKNRKRSLPLRALHREHICGHFGQRGPRLRLLHGTSISGEASDTPLR